MFLKNSGTEYVVFLYDNKGKNIILNSNKRETLSKIIENIELAYKEMTIGDVKAVLYKQIKKTKIKFNSLEIKKVDWEKK